MTAIAESLAHELRSRGWNAIASLVSVAVEGRDISGTRVCEIDDDDQHQPVDVNVYHYGPNGHVWQAGTTTHEAPEDIDTNELADRVIKSIQEEPWLSADHARNKRAAATPLPTPTSACGPGFDSTRKTIRDADSAPPTTRARRGLE